MKRRLADLWMVSLLVLGCDPECEEVPEDAVGNQTAEELGSCPALPPGVEAIQGLAVARSMERFDGLLLTVSTRPLPCGLPAAQHGFCPFGGGHGLTVGIPADVLAESTYDLREHPEIHVEYEDPERSSVGVIRGGTVELFTISDTCVTGRISGLIEGGERLNGGFRAPRCSP